MNGYRVNTYSMYRDEPIRSAWFIDWIAAVNDARFERSKLEHHCFVQVIELRSKEIIRYE